MKVTSKRFLKACSLSIALIGSTAVIATFTAPDYAYAKNGSGGGNGGGGGNSGGNGNGGGNSDKGNSGNGGGNANKGSSGKTSATGSGKSKEGKGTTNRGGGSAKKSGGKSFSLKDVFSGGKGKRTSAESSISGGKTQPPARQKASVRQQKPKQIERSLRPVARMDVATQLPDYKKNPSRRLRDPLVAAITDPDGSNKLKNLNASNAAAQAFQNASPNSNVSKIATYQEAAVDYYALRDDLTDARRELYEFNESYDGRSSEDIVEDIEALDPADPDYDVDRQDLAYEFDEARDFEEARAELADDVKDLRGDTRAALESAETAFFEASKGRTLTRDALGDFHENIGLPVTTAARKDRPEVTPYDLEAALDSGTLTGEPTDYKKNPSRRLRDPLVAAITDPDGSNKLKNLNASNAAAQAFQNASPNSNVSKIATYQEAAVDYYALRDDLTDARRELYEFNESYDGRSSEDIVEDIEALDPADPDYDVDRQDLAYEFDEARDFEEARAELADDVRDVRRETLFASKDAEGAFYQASKGAILTSEALTEFHTKLGLPVPIQ